MSPTCAICSKPATSDVRFRKGGEIVHTVCGESHVFVYGTLREGGALETCFPANVLRERATAPGFALHYARTHRSFPYLVHDAQASTTGELLTILAEDVEACDDLAAVHAMEVNAGYTGEMIDVETKGGRVTALAWVWTAKRYVGPRVPDDDWTHSPEYVARDTSALVVSEPTRATQSAPKRQPAPQRTDVAPSAPAPKVERQWKGVGQLVSGPHENEKWVIRVLARDGAEMWRGYSFTALTHWTKEHEIKMVKEWDDE